MFGFLLPKGLKKRKVRFDFEEEIELHESFLDALAQEKEKELGISEKKFEKPLPRRILKSFLFFILLFQLFFFFKAFQLQVIDREKYLALAQKNKFTFRQITAKRGVIYDSGGKQLVYNKASFDLFLQKDLFLKAGEKRGELLKEVASILDIQPERLKEKIDQSPDPEVLLYQNLPHQALILLKAQIDELPGFEIKENIIREYKDGPLFAHIIGYTGRINSQELKKEPESYNMFDWVGRSGLEKSYEKILRKNPGKLQIERDAKGNIISQRIISPPRSGESLVLWLDSGLQEKLTQELEAILNKFNVEKAAALAMDPRTGGVLALVSLPSYDNNLFQKGGNKKELKDLLSDPRQPLLDRVISGRYLTGSTIKPLIASAALEERIISYKKKINCKGKIIIPNPWHPDLPTIKNDWTVHGPTDLRKAIAESCNVYFYTIGGGFENQEGLGLERIKRYLGLFGWEDTTGIDIPGEVPGFVPDRQWKKKVLKENWVDGDTYNLAIGQGFLGITPLEVADAFSAIANGGKLLRPHLVKAVVDENKNIIESFGPELLRQNFIDPKNLEIVRQGMRWAVTGENSPKASAVLLNSLPVAAAAKTGTAELGNGYYNLWVTVFAPYENPEIVLTIVIEKIKGLQSATLPVAKEVLDWYFTRQ